MMTNSLCDTGSLLRVGCSSLSWALEEEEFEGWWTVRPLVAPVWWPRVCRALGWRGSSITLSKGISTETEMTPDWGNLILFSIQPEWPLCKTTWQVTVLWKGGESKAGGNTCSEICLCVEELGISMIHRGSKELIHAQELLLLLFFFFFFQSNQD